MINKVAKIIAIIIVVSFFSLYFTTIGGYYEYNLQQKKTLTEEAIQKFEEDVKNGKEIIASNYIEPEKDYNNNFSKLGMKFSNTISTTFDKVMKFIFKQIENTVNS